MGPTRPPSYLIAEVNDHLAAVKNMKVGMGRATDIDGSDAKISFFAQNMELLSM